MGVRNIHVIIALWVFIAGVRVGPPPSSHAGLVREQRQGIGYDRRRAAPSTVLHGPGGLLDGRAGRAHWHGSQGRLAWGWDVLVVCQRLLV